MSWKEKGSHKHFQNGQTTTKKGNLKRSFIEQFWIFLSKLVEYQDIEKWFNNYGLGCTIIAPRYYYRYYVHDFYPYYDTTLDSYSKKGKKVTNFTNLNKVRIHGLSKEIVDQTIKYFLYRPNFTPPANTADFEHKLRDIENQCPWCTP